MNDGAGLRDGMLYSVELRLKSSGGGALVRASGYHAYSFFLRLIETRDAGLSARLHQEGGPKPLTLSAPALLRPDNGSGGRGLEETARLRLTFMDEHLLAVTLDAVWSQSGSPGLSLGGARVIVDGVLTTPGQSRWASFASFQQILEEASDERKMNLFFRSPTTFRSKGVRNALFPEPGLVFGSLMARWNAFAPPLLALSMAEDLVASVRVCEYRLATRIMDFGGYQERGFVGQVTYELGDGLSEDAVRAVQALGAYSFYAGVGAKTTMGLGQCWRP